MAATTRALQAREPGVREEMPISTPRPKDDEQWVRRLRSRDAEAFREFVRAQSGRLYSLVYRLAARRDEVEDLVQEILIEVWKSLPSFRGDSSLKTWVHRIAVNTCIRHQRKRRPEEPFPECEDESMDCQPAVMDVDQSVLQSDLQHQVTIALNSLPEEFRQVVVLHEIEGLTHREMAQVLGIPVGTAKSRLFHALGKLRDRLEPYVLSSEETDPKQVMRP